MRAARKPDIRRYFAWVLVVALVLQAQLGAVLVASLALPPELCAAHDTAPAPTDDPVAVHEHCSLCQIATAPALPVPDTASAEPVARAVAMLPRIAAIVAGSAPASGYHSRAPPATV